MAVYNINPVDGTDGPDSLTYMIAQVANTAFPSPIIKHIYMQFDTSGVGGGETVTAARLWWHPYSYTASKGVAKTWSLVKYNGATGQGGVAAGTYSAGAAWVTLSHPEYWVISATNDIIWGYTNDVPGKDTVMRVYTQEYSVPASRPYLELTTTVPSTGATKSYVIMAG